jgi:hypothetical protein
MIWRIYTEIRIWRYIKVTERNVCKLNAVSIVKADLFINI